MRLLALVACSCLAAACAGEDSSSPLDGSWSFTLTSNGSGQLNPSAGSLDLIARTDGTIDGSWRSWDDQYGGTVSGDASGTSVHLTLDRSDAPIDVDATLTDREDASYQGLVMRGPATGWKFSVGFVAGHD